MPIGVISDTHGLLRPEALEALAGSDVIIHAGDVGSPDVLPELRNIARVIAVRGNVDHGAWANALPMWETLEFAGHTIYILHNIDHLDLKPAASGFAAVIYGHSHVPRIEERDGVLFLNPGSAGPRRFRLPVSVARLDVVDGRLIAEIVELEVK